MLMRSGRSKGVWHGRLPVFVVVLSVGLAFALAGAARAQYWYAIHCTPPDPIWEYSGSCTGGSWGAGAGTAAASGGVNAVTSQYEPSVGGSVTAHYETAEVCVWGGLDPASSRVVSMYVGGYGSASVSCSKGTTGQAYGSATIDGSASYSPPAGVSPVSEPVGYGIGFGGRSIGVAIAHVTATDGTSVSGNVGQWTIDTQGGASIGMNASDSKTLSASSASASATLSVAPVSSDYTLFVSDGPTNASFTWMQSGSVSVDVSCTTDGSALADASVSYRTIASF